MSAMGVWLVCLLALGCYIQPTRIYTSPDTLYTPPGTPRPRARTYNTPFGCITEEVLPSAPTGAP
jgi:hypothetical protein